MPNNRIDHFAVGAADLDQGGAALKAALGVETPRGGEHAAMGTHNCVMRAGDQCFLEILAIDPDAPDPGRTRWFTLDDPKTRARLAAAPGPLCWVVATDDLDAVVAASPVDLGEIVPFSRGDRSWRLTVPADGSLPGHGLIPAFIEWSPGPHPSAGMQDLGVALKRIELGSPDPEGLLAMLQALGVDHLAHVRAASAPTLMFTLSTPDKGDVLLGEAVGG